MTRETEPLVPLHLPPGPPLYLERPGRATELLGPFLATERLERLRSVLSLRTRHVTALVEKVHDPHNIAACVRSCDAFGIQDLHLVPSEGVPLLLSREVSIGAQRWLTIHRHPNTRAAIRCIRDAGYRIVTTDLDPEAAPRYVSELDISQPTCIAFGTERDGISDELHAAADGRVRIPMVGFSQSLNISVAFAITMHDLRRALDALPADTIALEETAEARILDRWVVEDTPRARAVLKDLARRKEGGSPGG